MNQAIGFGAGQGHVPYLPMVAEDGGNTIFWVYFDARTIDQLHPAYWVQNSRTTVSSHLISGIRMWQSGFKLCRTNKRKRDEATNELNKSNYTYRKTYSGDTYHSFLP